MNRHMLQRILLGLVLLLPAAALLAVEGERIKDLASIQGVRSNQLVGYGLVVGLDGSGDRTTQAPFTTQSIRSMLAAQGVQLPPGINLQTDNVAAVMITADLPAFAKTGQRLDITVSSLGNAQSLRGGNLLMAPLRGADGEVYAMAQGSLIVGGFGAQGADGSRIAVNIPSTGRIPNGASVEREVQNPFAAGTNVVLNLHTPDFTTARRMADVINENVGSDIAFARDAVSIAVDAPENTDQRVGFVAYLENLRVDPGEAPARVIVNSRTGTVVIGSHVRVREAAVTHGSLTVTISESFGVSQPAPFSDGQTVVTPRTDIEVTEATSPMFLFNPGVELREIVNAVNQVGAAPGDLISILEALKQAGALRAELIVI